MKNVPPPREGELVEVIPPHGEAGARGIVIKKFRANSDYEARARVQFHKPYGEGTEIIALRMLVPLR